MKLIGIAGKAGAGKNTVAGIAAARLVEKGFTVAVDSFAAPIKAWAASSLGWHGERGGFWREAMQRYGQSQRGQNEYCFIKKLAARHGHEWSPITNRLDPLPDQPPPPDFLIVCDARYENEFEVCKATGELWLVVGRGGLAGDAGSHASELGVEHCEPTATIPNGGTLSKLIENVQALADDLACVAGNAG